MSAIDPTTSVLADFNSAAAKRHRSKRNIKDNLFRYTMTAGGIGVIIAIVLIAFYLFYVVLPMFKSAHLEQVASYPLTGNASEKTLYYALEEQREVALRVTEKANLVFFKAADGSIIRKYNLFTEGNETITAFQQGDMAQALLAFGTASGKVLLVNHHYDVTYPESAQSDIPDSKAVKLITPYLTYPLGETPVLISEGVPIRQVTAQSDDEQIMVAALLENNRVVLKKISVETNMITDEKEFTEYSGVIEPVGTITHMILDKEQRTSPLSSLPD